MVISKDEYYIEQFGFLYIRIFFKRLIRNILLLREGKLIYSLLASSSGHFNSEKKKKKKWNDFTKDQPNDSKQERIHITALKRLR